MQGEIATEINGPIVSANEQTNLINQTAHEDSHVRRQFVLQKVQPALLGLMDGSVSTLAPLFATALATRKPMTAFYVGLAASVGAGISMGLAEAALRRRQGNRPRNAGGARRDHRRRHRSRWNAPHLSISAELTQRSAEAGLCRCRRRAALHRIHPLSFHEEPMGQDGRPGDCRRRDRVRDRNLAWTTRRRRLVERIDRAPSFNGDEKSAALYNRVQRVKVLDVFFRNLQRFNYFFCQRAPRRATTRPQMKIP